MKMIDNGLQFEVNEKGSPDYENRIRRIRRVAGLLSDLAIEVPTYPAFLDGNEQLNVETGERVAQLWSQLLSSTPVQVTFALTPSAQEDSHWLRVNDLDKLEYTVKRIREIFASLSELRQIDHYINELVKHLRAALRRSKAFNALGPSGIDDTIDILNPIQAEFLSLEEEIDERQRRRQAEAVAETEDALSAAKAASGSTGQTVMSTYYAKLGKDETESADRYRKLTVQFAITGGVAALIFLLLPTDLFGPPQGADIYVRLAQKVVFLGGIFALAGYFAKQAHQHRSLANWALSLAVQLQTFEAYLAAVGDPQVRDDLIKNFAARAFGEHPSMKGEQPVTSSAALLDTAANLAAKFTGAAK